MPPLPKYFRALLDGEPLPISAAAAVTFRFSAPSRCRFPDHHLSRRAGPRAAEDQYRVRRPAAWDPCSRILRWQPDHSIGNPGCTARLSSGVN